LFGFFVFQEIKNQETIIDHSEKKKKTVPQRKEEQKVAYFKGMREKKERKKTRHRPTN
jgi:hypothetical protein